MKKYFIALTGKKVLFFSVQGYILITEQILMMKAAGILSKSG